MKYLNWGRFSEIKISTSKLAFCLTFFLSISLWNSVLVGDEVFVLYSFGPELFDNPSKIWDWAITSSKGGWETGRWISPLSHLASNSGVYLTEATTRIFKVSALLSYDIWRSLVLATISVVFVAIVKSIAGNFRVPRETPGWLAAIIIPVVFVANSSYSSVRISIWSYGVLTLLGLLLALAFFQLHFYKPVGSGYLLFLVGLGFSTTYELTQALGPVVVVMGFLIQLSARGEGWRFRESIGAITRFELPFLAGFLIPFLVIRISSYALCVKGCYAPASIDPFGFSFKGFLSRLLSNNPLVSEFFALNMDSEWFLEKSYVIACALTFLATTVAASVLLKQTTKFKQVFAFGNKLASSLVILGTGIILVISAGMAMSKAVQIDLENTFGQGNRDTLIQQIGWGFVLTGIALIFLKALNGAEAKKRFLYSAIGLFTYAAMAAAMFLSNQISTQQHILDTPGSYIYNRFSSEMLAPEYSKAGDARRCDYVQSKIENFPAWEGHDRSLVYGLNLRMKALHGIPFCSSNPEILFEHYEPGQ